MILKSIYAVCLFCLCFFLFNALVELNADDRNVQSIPPPIWPMCEWDNVQMSSSLTATTAKVTAKLFCPTARIDGCYAEAIAGLYYWDRGLRTWNLIQAWTTDVDGPNCGANPRTYFKSVGRANLTPGFDYCLTLRVLDHTSGGMQVGFRQLYFSQ